MQDKYYLDDLDDEDEPPAKYSSTSSTAFSLPSKRIHKRPIVYNSTDPTDLNEYNKDCSERSTESTTDSVPPIIRISSTASCPEQDNLNTLDWPLLSFNENVEEISKIAKLTSEKQSGLVARLKKLSEFAHTELISKGYCGVNHLLGYCYAESILQLAKSLYEKDLFVTGEHAVKGVSVRCDKIIWIDPDNLKSLNSPSLHILLHFLDAVIVNLNEQLTECDLTHKSRAMLACYPNDSNGYDKHCDNPKALNDGRYLTCIYYLNPNWDSSVDGGDLLMWPDILNRRQISIAPLMDRALFFYADERTLHKVAPNKRERFALTVWYFDKTARQNYWVKHHREYMSKNS